MSLQTYFNNDDLAMSVWQGKYSDKADITPKDMHERMAREFARVTKLSFDEIMELFHHFKYVIPQGSIMATLGKPYKIASLSNCFVVGQPYDSYSGIMKKDEELVQLMKRRGGVGIDISTLRPEDAPVTNAAGSSTGGVSFMERYSNSTREVAQKGRRGALMISIDIRYPDIEKFIEIKKDLTKVTGANISIMLRDDFMKAVVNNEDYVLRWPCDFNDENVLKNATTEKSTVEVNSQTVYMRKVSAKEIYNRIIQAAWASAEPGIIYIDKHWDYSPDTVYPMFKGITTNPCFHPDTLIETEYGRLKIKDIKTSMRVYSMDADGKLVMSKASPAFISKKNANTIKVTLKSGSYIQVTPEHKLYIHNKGWVKAEDLVIGDKIGHLCRSRRGAKYAGIHLTTSPNRQKDQVMEHKFVYGAHEVGYDIHHIDRNTFNNSIDNLQLLSHSEHSRLTALEDNPQTHQVKDNFGKFITSEFSKKGKKLITNITDNLKTNLFSPYHNAVISIEHGETTDVYDITVENTHCVIANNMVAHNCGEIFMGKYDACRLIALNLYGFVDKPFTKDARIDYDKLYEFAYKQQVLADGVIDLEVEHINRILDKIDKDRSNAEDPSIYYTEYSLWENIRNITQSGRRTGCGFTGLGDMLAALGVKYDSDKALEIIDKVMHTKFKAELNASINMAEASGSFTGFDAKAEFDIHYEGSKIKSVKGKNEFFQMLVDNFYPEVLRMIESGRRNVSFSTVAPTGSVSILTQTTSGLEPLFNWGYMRRKKVNPGDSGVRVDFTDQNGDCWMEYPVVHPKFVNWYCEFNNISYEEALSAIQSMSNQEIQDLFVLSPWYGSTANDIDWTKRVEIQGIIQKYTTHSISSTINLPNEVTVDEVATIYTESWKKGLKGVTIYRDGCRTGVLVQMDAKKADTFEYKDAPKRPEELPVDIYHVKVKNEPYTILVGLFDRKPYEVFCIPNLLCSGYKTGFLKKKSRGIYNLTCTVDNEFSIVNDITKSMSDEQQAITRLISTSLRHGADIKFIVEQLLKTDGELNSFTKAIARTLKQYIPDGTTSTATCLDCGSKAIIYEEGCQKCQQCGSSKCG
jgi:ribonucleotide reductase alpha subunit